MDYELDWWQVMHDASRQGQFGDVIDAALEACSYVTPESAPEDIEKRLLVRAAVGVLMDVFGD